ncbi:MAG: 30S ribosomal protein S21 [Dehalococcoidales bacterium]|nr:30S ribosomal protein S21 [Dehalococcoidales bacterium]
MSNEVRLRDGETQESLLKRFQKSVLMSGVLKEAKAHRYFMSKGETERLKAKNAARKSRQKKSDRY